jgi:hypothetical protein
MHSNSSIIDKGGRENPAARRFTAFALFCSVELLHALLMVFLVTLVSFNLALLFLAVIQKILDDRDQKYNADAEPDGEKKNEKCCL